MCLVGEEGSGWLKNGALHPSLTPAEVRSSTLEVRQSVWTWECHKQLRQGVHVESAWPDQQAEGRMRGPTPSSFSS